MTPPTRLKVRARLSVAIQVTDARSGEVLTAGVAFHFPAPEPRWESRLTPDGFHAFIGLPPGRQMARVIAPGYQPLDTTFTVPEKPDDSNAVLTLALQPASARAIR
ncbi:hypothetical protein D7W79_28615 [Corallococcus exercitus]|uniref:hypothetical protein n=1 Tax=Corallococcus exercitus TaxID=2316736 RepID=UPI000EA3C7E0|nr:hypothetical protein [Corallococcus exercitus]RKG72380.1 hypothetical protein D7W79_28615 [Corallococcus exercitus]